MACDISLIYPGILFYWWRFSTKPGWHVLSGHSIDVPGTATGAGPHIGYAGRVGDPLHWSEVGEDVPERATRMHTRCQETMAQNTDRTGLFGDFSVDLNVKASRGRHGADRADLPMSGGRRRYGAERADLPTPGGSSAKSERPGEETV